MTSLLMNWQLKLGPALSGLYVLRKVISIYLNHLIDVLFKHGWTSLTHCGREDLRKWTIFNTILTSPKSWLSQEDLDAGFEHSLMPMDS